MVERPLGSGKWRLRVFAGKDPITGKPRQVSKTVSARSKKAAQNLLNDFISEQSATPTAGTGASVSVVLEEWYRHSIARGRAKTTLNSARKIIDNVLVPEFGSVAVGDLTARHLDELYLKLSTDTSKGRGQDTGLSPSSVRRYHAVLSAAMAQAVKWGWIDRNPAERATPPSLVEVPLVIPTTDEVKALLSAGRARAPKWGTLLALALATGARRGEICALRWDDINVDTVRIRRSLWRAGEERGEKGTKGGRERWVYVGPVAAVLLADWKLECLAVAAKAGVELVPDAFVVSTMPDGSRPVNPDTLSSVVTKLCADLEISHVHLHSLRHYAATELIGSGVSPRDAAELLGHADPALTLRVYTHSTSARQKKAGEILERALIPGESAEAS